MRWEGSEEKSPEKQPSQNSSPKRAFLGKL